MIAAQVHAFWSILVIQDISNATLKIKGYLTTLSLLRAARLTIFHNKINRLIVGNNESTLFYCKVTIVPQQESSH